MPSRFITTIDRTGPFFKNDPGKTFKANARVMLERLVEEGQADVIAQMLSGQAQRAPISVIGGRVSEHVDGRVASRSGKPWQATGVISVGPAGEAGRGAVALMAAASRVEAQTHAFRRTTGRLQRARSVNTAELLKGIQ